MHSRRGVAVSALHSTRCLAALMMLAMPAAVLAQGRSSVPLRTEPKTTSTVRESKSAELAVELKQLLEARSLTNIAAALKDSYVGALYAPGMLLVVSGKANSGERMEYLLQQKSYKEAYQDLNSASDRSSKILISDLGANGLKFKQEKDQPFDMVDIAGKSLAFDGKWGGKDNVSREEYTKTYETTDEQYSQMLQTLIEAVKKSS